jgi:hypothetical protein
MRGDHERGNEDSLADNHTVLGQLQQYQIPNMKYDSGGIGV